MFFLKLRWTLSDSDICQLCVGNKLFYSSAKNSKKKKIDYIQLKKLSLCHKILFSNPHYLFNPRSYRLKIFQTINYVKSNILRLKYQKFTPSGCKDIGIIKYEFVAKSQFLYIHENLNLWKI